MLREKGYYLGSEVANILIESKRGFSEYLYYVSTIVLSVFFGYNRLWIFYTRMDREPVFFSMDSWEWWPKTILGIIFDLYLSNEAMKILFRKSYFIFYAKSQCLKEISRMTDMVNDNNDLEEVNYLDKITVESIGTLRKIFFNHWKDQDQEANVFVTGGLLCYIAFVVTYFGIGTHNKWWS